jgi:hypothetical protein
MSTHFSCSGQTRPYQKKMTIKHRPLRQADVNALFLLTHCSNTGEVCCSGQTNTHIRIISTARLMSTHFSCSGRRAAPSRSGQTRTSAAAGREQAHPRQQQESALTVAPDKHAHPHRPPPYPNPLTLLAKLGIFLRDPGLGVRGLYNGLGFRVQGVFNEV